MCVLSWVCLAAALCAVAQTSSTSASAEQLYLRTVRPRPALSAGALIEPLPADLYTGHLPLAFEVDLHSGAVRESNLTGPPDQQGDALPVTTLQEEASRRFQDLFDTCAESRRHRRAEDDPFSHFFGWYCSLLRKKDLWSMVNEQSHLQRVIGILHQAIDAHGAAIRNSSEELQLEEEVRLALHSEEGRAPKLTAARARLLQHLGEQGGQMSPHARGTLTRLAQVLDAIALGLEAAMLEAAGQACSHSRFPTALVAASRVAGRLQQLAAYAEAHGHRLTFHETSLPRFLSAPLTHCSHRNGSFLVFAQVPIIPTRAHFRLNRISAFQFAWLGSTCSLQLEDGLVAEGEREGRREVRFIGGAQQLRCGAGSLPLCYLPESSSPSLYMDSCARELLAGAGGDIRRWCPVLCVPRSDTRLQAAAEGTVLVTHPPQLLYLRCPRSSTRVAVEMPAVGALQVSVPCNCSLEGAAGPLWTPRFPCLRGSRLPGTAVHLVLSAWERDGDGRSPAPGALALAPAGLPAAVAPGQFVAHEAITAALFFLLIAWLTILSVVVFLVVRFRPAKRLLSCPRVSATADSRSDVVTV